MLQDIGYLNGSSRHKITEVFMKAWEVNFDGLAGPAYNFAGLSFGNLASLKHAKQKSNPKHAAKQGLAKMKALADMGLIQGVIAPHERPDLQMLRRLGFTGSETQMLVKAAKQTPEIFLACYSASAVWTANAATVSPGADTLDKRIHFTPANLQTLFHRSLEPALASDILHTIFKDEKHFVHHTPLPKHHYFSDEGAANHTRFCQDYGSEGVECFIYGRHGINNSHHQPKHFPARHTLEASMAIARLHQLNPNKVVFAQQNPEVIDQGVFHNDVIAVGNMNVLFHHEKAFLNTKVLYDDLNRKMSDGQIHFIEVKTAECSVKEAVESYLFNSQLITLSSGKMILIAPAECKNNLRVKQYLDYLVQSDHPIQDVMFFDLRQSMKNGGGPACLRLRVVLNEQELAAVNPAVFINDTQYARLDRWIEKHYRDALSADDLCDISFLTEIRTALDELTTILNLGSVYSFQKN